MFWPTKFRACTFDRRRVGPSGFRGAADGRDVAPDGRIPEAAEMKRWSSNAGRGNLQREGIMIQGKKMAKLENSNRTTFGRHTSTCPCMPEGAAERADVAQCAPSVDVNSSDHSSFRGPRACEHRKQGHMFRGRASQIIISDI